MCARDGSIMFGPSFLFLDDTNCVDRGSIPAAAKISAQVLPSSMTADDAVKNSPSIPQKVLTNFVAESAPVPAVGPATPSPIRKYLSRQGSGKLADQTFGLVMLLCALSIFAIVIFIASILVLRSHLTIAKFGFRFFTGQSWDPVNGEFGALPFIFGTLATSLLALILAVPLALGVAIFLTELCPKALRGPISFLTELLAAIPSVVYGLWAIFVLVPIVRDDLGPALVKYLGWTGFFGGSNFGVGLLTASLILSIMILPIISSITRDIMLAVPNHQREAVLALGATRWEMIRTGVLRNARIGIVGAIILGLGRALGK